MGYTQVTLLQVIACILISLLRISHPYSTSQGARHAVVAAHICWMDVAKGWGQPFSSTPTTQLLAQSLAHNEC